MAEELLIRPGFNLDSCFRQARYLKWKGRAREPCPENAAMACHRVRADLSNLPVVACLEDNERN